MLNGKFYMGLPPDMLDRGAPQRNRLQSSIFWPDDTKVDSALETRVKRRNSLQIAQAERPPLRMQSSASGRGNADVNTRQLFQNEFAKSSIEFLDNLCDNTMARKPLLFRGNSTEVTPKPTALKLPLPENVVNAGYTTAKKKQAFTSKIEFNDYAGDELNNRNNLRRAKMDMNDKKEMERNTKNSPKLLVKNNMRSLGASDRLYPAERREKVVAEDLEHTKIRAGTEIALKNNTRNEVEDRYAGGDFDDEFDEGRSGSSGNKVNLRSRDNRLRSEHLRQPDFMENRRAVNPEYGYRRDHRNFYADDSNVSDYAPIARYGVPVRRANSVGRFSTPTNRILKNPTRERRYYDDYAKGDKRVHDGSRVNTRYRDRNCEVHDNRDYADVEANADADIDADVDYMEGRMKNMRIRTSPKKHVTYSDDTYSHDEEMPSHSQRQSQLRERAPPNLRTGSNQQRQQQQQVLRHYNSEIDLVEDANEALEPKFMANDVHDNEATMETLNIGSSYNNIGNEERYGMVNKINNNKNNNYNNTTSRLNHQTISSAARKITSKMPTAATTKQNADTSANEPTEAVETGVKKHLRSSLCLHNGEIIASDDGATTSAKAPTRSARSTATRQRISVGLPD